MSLDVSPIIPLISQGALPPPGDDVRRHGFDVLVLAAQEYQPPANMFPGVHVLYSPMDDAELSSDEWRQVVNTSRKVARHVRAGRRVLITCQAGLNRSGIHTAVVMHLLTGQAGSAIVRHIRARRTDALFNKSFVRRLEMLRTTALTP